MKNYFIAGQVQLPESPVWIWVTAIIAFMLVALILFSLISERSK